MKPRFFVGDVQCRERLGHVCTDACHYRVVTRINPHMQPGAVDFARARAQHRAFIDTLRFVGADVDVLPFIHGCPDSVFVKDMGIVVGDHDGVHMLLACPRHPERGSEQAHRRHHLQARGVEVTPAPPTCFEGGDVVLTPKHAFVGVGPRTSREASPMIARFLHRPLQRLELIDDRFFHLDTCFTVLKDGTALVAAEALSPASLALLREHPAIARVVTVDVETAMRFGLNVVEVGDLVVVNSAAAPALRKLGLRVVGVDLSEFLLAGGGAACLVARVNTRPLLHTALTLSSGLDVPRPAS